MANFNNNAITDVGRSLFAEVQAGAVFIPTRIVIGSGALPSGKTPATMTSVVTPVASLTINKKERTPDGKAIYGGVYSNKDIAEAFYFRELALYAKAEYRDETGAVTKAVPECLYSYGNAGNSADYMPAYSTSTVVERQMDLVVYVGNDTQIDLTIDSGVYVTREEFEQAMEYAGGGLVIIPQGGDVPVDQRKEGFMYFRVGAEHALQLTPNVLLAFE
jgi:hypothetical protein